MSPSGSLFFTCFYRDVVLPARTKIVAVWLVQKVIDTARGLLPVCNTHASIVNLGRVTMKNMCYEVRKEPRYVWTSFPMTH